MRKLKLDELQRLKVGEYQTTPKNPIVVVLDNIRSGVNVGSFFRTSDAFLIEKLHLCGITPKPPHKEIFKTAIGAHETVAWTYWENTVACVQQLKQEGYICVGVEQTDQSQFLHQRPKLDKPIAVFFGNEVKGLSDELLPYLDTVWEIPQFGTKHSLNVSITGGIVLWDIIREIELYQK